MPNPGTSGDFWLQAGRGRELSYIVVLDLVIYVLGADMATVHSVACPPSCYSTYVAVFYMTAPMWSQKPLVVTSCMLKNVRPQGHDVCERTLARGMGFVHCMDVDLCANVVFRHAVCIFI